ncbi:MAG TPA: trypsin-like peptidase domain-containing protein [Vicinamibacteria bacterium]|nr:trypsin-like peptidase domain-containing protein [Vicinamibacteria bacterium]
MARLRFVHVTGPRAGEANWLPRLPATIGSDAEADVVVPGTAPRHAVVFERDGEVVLLDSGSAQGTYLAGQLVQETGLKPGDVLELGPGGPRLRFERGDSPSRVYDPARPVAPVLLTEPSSAGPASQTMVLRALAQSSRTFRRSVLAASLVGLALLGWTWRENRRVQSELDVLRQAMAMVDAQRRSLAARVDGERRRGEAQRRTLEERVEEYRTREEELRTRLAQAAAGEVQSLRQELSGTRQRIATLESERAAGEQIIRQYGAGVCLIQGAYAFYDASNRPLRYKREAATDAPAEGTSVLSAEGEGAVHTVEYYGTGFLVQKGGLVLTNRHVAEPWWNDSTADALQREGFEPRFLYFRAFFPLHRDPFDLEMERRSDRYDLALLRAALRDTDIPVLPLESRPKRTVPGQPVVVVGYPTGLEAILAKAESGQVRRILESHGTDSERVTLALSRQGLIRPSTTQGHIGDITPTDIVFDAPSAQGGSGGPVFNKYGQVVAVEYAVLQKFGGNSFGIPIAYARELLSSRARARTDD